MTPLARFLTAACLAAWLPPCFAQDLKISSGAGDEQVIQRNAEERGDLKLGGTSPSNGKYIEARVLKKDGSVLTGFDWKVVNKVERSHWEGEIKGIPTGGPYKVEVRVAGTASPAALNNVLVGDLWVLAGQSNMQGVGDLIDVQKPSELIHSFDMADHWGVAQEPLHTLVNAADRIHWPRNKEKQQVRYEGEQLRIFLEQRTKGAGLGLPFAAEILRRTGVPIGLVPCAHGGTSMDEWDPGLKMKGSDSLYGSMLRRFKAVGGRIKGVLWYQGESDANPKAAPEFGAKFEKFVTAVREDFAQPDLPFYYVQIGRHVSSANVSEWNAVQETQRKAEPAIPRVGMVPAVDLSLDDGIHVSTQDHKRLGVRFANLVSHDLFPSLKEYTTLKHGPRPLSARVDGSLVRVAFADVNGRLRSAGRISGFSIHLPSGEAIPAFYRARVDPQDPNSVLLDLTGKLPEGAVLRYGAGKDPYCNLTDDADMGTPVFGPMAIAH